MKSANLMTGVLVGSMLLLCASCIEAQDWPQWRGAHRDAKAAGFTAPATWPKELMQKWQVEVGLGDASPAVVGDRVYVFTRQGSDEITLCLDAASGKELWKDKYPAEKVTGAAANVGGGHPGPRSSCAVADGKVCTLGVGGVVSCLDAATGKPLWRKDTKAWPKFFTSSSPIIVDGLCIAQVGGPDKAATVAYDLVTGNEKWTWSADGAAYASPVLLEVDGAKALVVETDKNVAAIGLADGKLLWEAPFAVPARSRGYNAATPIVDGQTIIYAGSGRGTKAIKLEKQGDKLTARELWSNPESSVQFNTPVLTDGLIFGLSDRDSLFCLNAGDGKTAWKNSIRGGRGFGSIVGAGPVVLVLTPSSELIVLERSDKEFKQIAKYKVAATPTYAYPVLSGNRIFIKDRDKLTLWTVE